MNETPVWFDMAGSLTVNPKGAKTVHVWPTSTPPLPAGVVIWFQEKRWMDESGIKNWIRYWNSMWPGFRNSRTMLVLDSFAAHITDQTKTAFHLGNTDLAVIPRGLTSMCQPFDICINKPFKNKLRGYWHKWMADGGNGLTKGRNLRHADFISNCLSGSEDHFIYDDKDDEHSNENSDDYEDGSEIEFDDNEKSDEDEESYENE
ncbi:33033_t:CDS:2, partial [Gigaspora margarita]